MDLSLIVATDRRMAGRPLLDVVSAAVDGGARTFWLREKDLPAPERRALADAIRAMGADVIAGGPDPLGGNAVHLSASDPVPGVAVVGRSCHSVAEVEALTVEAYCTLSPIFETSSKPGYGPALGVGVLRRGIVALGGVDTPEKVRECMEAGASGVAVMGAVMRASDPASVVKGLLWTINHPSC
ncbi:MAG TPA: thiamine phosphate synthase [Candidatus Limnocylindrales bacterium]